MRNCRQKQLIVVLVSVIAVVIISGCAIKHSDVMLFGTNTKYGLSIAMDQPENTPHINVGYKRQEFVWMPLVANGADSVIQNKVATANAQDLKYIGKEPTGKEDTYSVLASFGADFKASGAAGGGPACPARGSDQHGAWPGPLGGLQAGAGKDGGPVPHLRGARR